MCKTLILTLVAMLAFAGNSILCRMALKETAIDPATFTAIRLLSGAVVLCVILLLQRRWAKGAGSWAGGCMLFVYALCFSYAYIGLSAAAGALILFGAVQVTMIGVGMVSGEKLSAWQWLGLFMAAAGLVGLLLPGASAPPLMAAVLMVFSGVAWGVYSLLGRGAASPTLLTGGNFLRASLLVLLVWPLMAFQFVWDDRGALLAVASGAAASGAGYAIWYAVLPALRATTAASIQLTVPVITAIAGVLLLNGTLTARLIIASVVVLGGISLVIRPAASASS